MAIRKRIATANAASSGIPVHREPEGEAGFDDPDAAGDGQDAGQQGDAHVDEEHVKEAFDGVSEGRA